MVVRSLWCPSLLKEPREALQAGFTIKYLKTNGLFSKCYRLRTTMDRAHGGAKPVVPFLMKDPRQAMQAGFPIKYLKKNGLFSECNRLRTTVDRAAGRRRGALATQ
jgi:hypothetical protein